MNDATIIKDWCAACGMPEPSAGECQALAVAIRLAPQAPAASAAVAVPEGFALVPIVLTEAMDDVLGADDWTWPELLAAAEAITELEYDALAATLAAAKTYIEVRECSDCGHIGINDDDGSKAACNTCDWQGESPVEDRCPGCHAVGTMTSACPECGSRTSLLAETDLLAAAPQAPAAPVVKQCGTEPVFLEVRAGVRYWEDAKVNGVEDERGDLIPLRSGDDWVPTISLADGLIEGWPQGTSADIHYKVCDDGEYFLLNADRQRVRGYEGYVPDMLAVGDNGYGDYIILKVGPTGHIEGWSAPSIDTEEWPLLATTQAAPAAPAVDAWQPIETAPKNGRLMLLGYINSCGKWRTTRGQWINQEYIDEYAEDPDSMSPGWYETTIEDDDGKCWPIKPTRWQPLPPPPQGFSNDQ